jgi:hypothetical protein
VEHQKGTYRRHYVIEDGNKIFDPFLNRPIPKDKYLAKVYKNPDELRLVLIN